MRTLHFSRRLSALCACQATRAPTTPSRELRGGDAQGGAPFVEADAADPLKVRGFDVEDRGNDRRRDSDVQPRFLQVSLGVDRAVCRAR